MAMLFLILLKSLVLCEQYSFYTFSENNGTTQTINFTIPTIIETQTLYITQISQSYNIQMNVCCQNELEQNCINGKYIDPYTNSIRLVNISIDQNYSFYNELGIQEFDSCSILITNSDQFQFNISLDILYLNECQRTCQHSGVCSNGFCQCQNGYFNIDCSLLAYDITTQDTLNSQLFYYANVDGFSDQQLKIIFDESVSISFECYLSNPYIYSYENQDYSKQLDISQTQIQNCQELTVSLNSLNNVLMTTNFLFVLKDPSSVGIKVTNYSESFNPIIIGIVLAVMGLFVIIIVILCYLKYKRQEARRLRTEQENEQIKKKKELQKIKFNNFLPEFPYAEVLKKYPGLKEDDECEICLGNFKLDDKVRVTYCTHVFHIQCIEHWLEKHDTCPMCRKTLDLNLVDQVLQEEGFKTHQNHRLFGNNEDEHSEQQQNQMSQNQEVRLNTVEQQHLEQQQFEVVHKLMNIENQQSQS